MSAYRYHSPTRIAETLRNHGANVLKRRGQNFLVDPNHADILSSLILKNCGNEIVEIGPGLGAITHRLLEAGRSVVGIEIDSALCEILREDLCGLYPGFRLIHDDALRVLSELPPFHHICGNLPYYITTDLLISSARLPEIESGLFLTQLEFAERAAAKISDSSLSVFLHNFGRWDIVHRVPERAFYPVPKVKSAAILFRREGAPRSNPEILERVLRASFGARRKTIRNSWKMFSCDETFAELILSVAGELGIDVGRRAEELSHDDYYSLAAHMERNLQKSGGDIGRGE